ncbi:MAG: aminotransferase class V-fold PLP-dependent enzyme [Planctomycetota bacterium JB042]
MPLDIDAIRRETPGCVPERAHFLHCGASLPPARVVRAAKDHLDLEAAVGGYEAERRAESGIEAARRSVARLLSAQTDEIALVENATIAWNQAFWSVVWTLRPGDRIATCRADYASNAISLLQAKRRRGVEIDVVPDDVHGAIDVEALARRLEDERVKLVTLTHVPTGNGLVNPAEEVGRAARARGVPFLLDACQSAGQLALDVDAIGCDFLSATGRKHLRGPRGTGFLYARRDTTARFEPATLDLLGATWTDADAYAVREDARRYETWERNVAGMLGLGAAVDLALELGLDAIEERSVRLADLLRARLAAIDGVEGRDLGVRRGGIVAFTHSAHPPDRIVRALAARGIEVGTSTVVSTRHQMEDLGLDAVVRAGVHYLNTEEEVERLAEAIRTL